MSLSQPVVAARSRTPILVNAGCGPKGGGRVPSVFEPWRQLRVDLDPVVEPDIMADITDLGLIPDGHADALWSAHCIEHLYLHQVPVALREFRRVLNDGGFACIIVPDLQTIATEVAADRLHEVLYHAPVGPVTAHDVVFGFGNAIAAGRTSMAHRCGFTPTMLINCLKQAGFSEFVIRRRSNFELAAVAFRQSAGGPDACESLLAKLEL